LIVCHWFVIDFCRHLAAPGVPEGVSPTRRDAGTGAGMNTAEALDQRGDLGADGRSSGAVRVGPFLSDQAVVPPQDGARRDQPVRPQPSGQVPDQRGQHARSAQSRRGLGLVRRSTATSCRRTSSSAFFDAYERPSNTSQPASRVKIRYSRRRDTADHHALRLRREHRCSSQPQADFWHPTGWLSWLLCPLCGDSPLGRCSAAMRPPGCTWPV
jgi:hypothetical protein